MVIQNKLGNCNKTKQKLLSSARYKNGVADAFFTLRIKSHLISIKRDDVHKESNITLYNNYQDSTNR